YMEKPSPENLDPNSRIERNSNIFAADVDDEMVMMDGEQGMYFGLNSVARTIWELLEQPRECGDLLSRLQEVYEVDAERCRAEVEPFLRKMLEKRLIRIQPE